MSKTQVSQVQSQNGLWQIICLHLYAANCLHCSSYSSPTRSNHAGSSSFCSFHPPHFCSQKRQKKAPLPNEVMKLKRKIHHLDFPSTGISRRPLWAHLLSVETQPRNVVLLFRRTPKMVDMLHVFDCVDLFVCCLCSMTKNRAKIVFFPARLARRAIPSKVGNQKTTKGNLCP